MNDQLMTIFQSHGVFTNLVLTVGGDKFVSQLCFGNVLPPVKEMGKKDKAHLGIWSVKGDEVEHEHL